MSQAKVEIKESKTKVKKSNKKSKSQHGIAYWSFVGPSLFAFSLVVLIPLILGIYYSFTNWNGIGSNIEWVGLKNYIKENRLYSLDESDAETKEKNNRLWKQVSVKTEKYKPVSDNVLVTVLREKEFKDFVKKKEIKNPCFENNKSKSCIFPL